MATTTVLTSRKKIQKWFKLDDGEYYRKVQCPICGKERWHPSPNIKRGLRCRDCWIKQTRGEKHYNWKGGRFERDGYILIQLLPDDFFYPMACKTGYVREHRLVVAKALGRCLLPWEIIHHKNGVRNDNRYPENLELATSNESHIKQHSKGYTDGYKRGFTDGRSKQIQELKTQNEELLKNIKLLQWQIKEWRSVNVNESA